MSLCGSSEGASHSERNGDPLESVSKEGDDDAGKVPHPQAVSIR